tara:strand:- start:323 stop:706 length:384 start_codon:yes stop_codon:yes gene_type:complete
MKLSGVGVDIIENSRIKKMIKNKNFLKRVFSNYEILNSKKILNKTSFFAKRFAAKEAFSKSLGTGFRNNLNFKDIVIKNNRAGKPFFYITKKIKSIINKKFKTKKFNFFLSISDEKNYSVAFVIFQK